MKTLLKRIDNLSEMPGRRWERENETLRVALYKGARHHSVLLSRDEERYVFRAVVLSNSEVTRNKHQRHRIARRAWRRNASKALVTFGFDKHDRLVGQIEAPAATLDQDELVLYIETLARECDRFEYVLTGQDVE